MNELFYASKNPGKLNEIGSFLPNWNILTPRDLDQVIEVDESSFSIQENARRKVLAYQKLLPNKLILADDTGIEIEHLNGKPGSRVRRWQDGETEMSDQAIIQYCIQQLQGVPLAKRNAKIITIMALAQPESPEVIFFYGDLTGHILEQPTAASTTGFPFDSLLYIDDWQKNIGETRNLPESELEKYPSQRIQALEKVVVYLNQAS